MALFYASPTEVVGSQGWRVVVCESPVLPGERGVADEFLDCGTEAWLSQALWRETEPPAAARALFGRYRREPTLELEPGRHPVLPGL